MFYAWDVTVPAGRAEATPYEASLKLSSGVITAIDVKFPAGCHGLVKLRLLRAEFQLVPLTRGQWVTGDDETVPTESYYELEGTPTELKLVACSPGTTYDHTITVRVRVLPRSVASTLPLMELMAKVFGRIFGVGG